MHGKNSQFLDLDGGYDVSKEGETESGMQRCLLVPCHLPSCGRVTSACLFGDTQCMAAHGQLVFYFFVRPLGCVVSLLGLGGPRRVHFIYFFYKKNKEINKKPNHVPIF